MLIDDIHPINRKLFPQVLDVLQQNRYSVNRFLISDEVTVAIAEMVRDHPEVVFNNLQFAISPYKTCYIEMNLYLYIETLGVETTHRHDDDDTCDHKTGFYIDDNIVTTLANSFDRRQGFISPILFSLRKKENTKWIQIPFSLETKLAYIMGSSLQAEKASIGALNFLNNNVDVWGRHEYGYDNLIKFAGSAAGEVRTLYAILLWLSQPTALEIKDMPASRKFGSGGTQRANPAYRVVRLGKANTKYMVKHFNHRNPPRLHEVRSFLRTYNKDPNCQHDWPIEPDHRGHWNCRKCKQYRMLVKEFLRGDPDLGVVEKEYKAIIQPKEK